MTFAVHSAHTDEVYSFVAMGEGERPLGYLTMERDGSDGWTVLAIRVEEPHRGQGIGKALVRAAQGVCGTDLVVAVQDDGTLTVGDNVRTTRILTPEALSWLVANIPKAGENNGDA